MKFVWKKIALVLTVVLLLSTLSGCAEATNVPAAFENAGYTFTLQETKEAAEQALNAEFEGKISPKKIWVELLSCDVYIAEKTDAEAKKTYQAVIVKFESEDAAKAFFGDQYAQQEKECDIRGEYFLASAIVTDGKDSVAVDNEQSPIVFEKYTQFEPFGFVDNAVYMGAGMLGIFVVIGLIIIVTYILNKVTAPKKED